MKISQLASADERGALNILQSFPLWNSDVESLSKHQLLASYSLIKSRLGIIQATHLMRHLKGEALLAFMLGDVLDCPLIYWRPPAEDLVSPHLLSFLRSLSFNSRACVLVSLAENAPVASMSRLKWSEVRLNTWADLSKRILKRIPPRLGCESVFWEENTLGRPGAVSGIEDLIRHDLDVSWEEFAQVALTLVQFEHFAHPEIEQLLFTEKSS